MHPVNAAEICGRILDFARMALTIIDEFDMISLLDNFRLLAAVIRFPPGNPPWRFYRLEL